MNVSIPTVVIRPGRPAAISRNSTEITLREAVGLDPVVQGEAPSAGTSAQWPPMTRLTRPS